MKERDIERTNEDAIILNKIESWFEKSPDGFYIYENKGQICASSHFPFHRKAKNIQFFIRKQRITDEFSPSFNKETPKLKARKNKLNMMVNTGVLSLNDKSLH